MPQFKLEEMKDILDTSYEALCIGSMTQPPADRIARRYLDSFGSPELAVVNYADEQAKKNSTTGFLAGLGGFLTRNETDEVKIAGVIQEQMLIAGVIAALGGHDIHEDETKVKIYSCLVDPSFSQLAESPDTNLEKVTDDIAVLLQEKYSTSSFMDFIKAVPVAGGLASIRWDAKAVKAVAGQACETFLDTNILYRGN